jgi:multidrug efflux pump subunit AcrA (membrane-fusion protein)
VTEYDVDVAETGLRARQAEFEARAAADEARVYEEVQNFLEERSRIVNLDEAEFHLRKARERQVRMPGLLADGFVSPEEAAACETEARKADSERLKAEFELQVFRSYERPMEIARRRNAETSAASSLATEKRRLGVRMVNTRLSMEEQKAALAEMAAEFEKIREIRGRMEVRSPADGIVIYGDPDEEWERDEELRAGAKVWGDEVLMTIPDLGEMHALLKVPEDRVYRLRQGLEARVEVNFGGRKSLAGKVARIGELAEDRGGEQREFEVEIVFDSGELDLRPRLTASIEIPLGSADGVLYVPEHAVRKEGGASRVTVLSGGVLNKVDVKTGIAGGGFVEIREGLSEGDLLFVGPGGAQEGTFEEGGRN